jgi:hypothetical protein
MREGNIYGCSAGDYVGSMLLFIESDKSSYGFLKIPSMENLWVPKDKFDFGVEQCIIEYIERVPKYVRKTSKAKFNENRNIRKIQG